MGMSGDRFTLAETALEGVRTVQARGFNAAVFAFIVAIFAGLVFAVGYLDTARIESHWLEQTYAGSNVFSVTVEDAANSASLDSARCEQARSIEGVRSAGAVLRSTEVFATTSPSDRFTFMSVTPGFLTIAYPRDPRIETTSSVAGNDVVDRIGLADDGTFGFVPRGGSAESSSSVGIATTSAARREPYDRAVMVASAEKTPVFECLVEAEPGAKESVAGALVGWFNPTTVKINPELPTNALVEDPVTELRSRYSQWVAVGAGVVLTVTFLLAWWARRADYANYRAFGMSASRVVLLLSTEAAITMWLPVCVGFAGALCLFAPALTPVPAGLILSDLAALGMVIFVAPLLGALMLTRKSPFAFARGE